MLRELGNKVKKMEKLSPGDILLQVHDAAEELQKKIDRRSYLLVNAESWEIGTRTKVLDNPEDVLNMKDNEHNENENKVLAFKSRSEAVLDLRSLPISQSWDVRNNNNGAPYLPPGMSTGNIFKTQISWPARLSFNGDAVHLEEDSKTYESASALSLATFSSLLIEFVARLQNLVDSFKELSEAANFKEPIIEMHIATEAVGLWTRLCRCFRFKN